MLSALSLGGCFWHSFGECVFEDETLATGEAVNGVSPDDVFAPLFTVHEGTVTWVTTGETTPLTVTVTREGAAQYETTECSSEVSHSFRIYGAISAVSADGLFDVEEDLFNVTLDASGTEVSISDLYVSLSYDELRAAGVGFPTTISGPTVGGIIVFDPDELAPRDFTISANFSSDRDGTLAEVRF